MEASVASASRMSYHACPICFPRDTLLTMNLTPNQTDLLLLSVGIVTLILAGIGVYCLLM